MLDYQFKQLENELFILEILKDYSDKALVDYIDLSNIYLEILEWIKKYNSVEYGIYFYNYSRNKTHYTLLELDLENKTFKSRCGTGFDFNLYEEILEKAGTSVSILFLEDSIITETKLRPIILNDKLRYANNFGITPAATFDSSIKDIKHLSKFMKQMIPTQFHKFNGIKGNK
jgi:hypothetical protein